MKYRQFRFNQGFSFSRDRLSAFMKCSVLHPTGTTHDIAQCMGVNRPVSEGFRGWYASCGLGVLKEKSYYTSVIGSLIYQNDPYLADIGTQWLLHYGITTDIGFRATIWHYAFNHLLAPGLVIEASALAEQSLSTLELPPTNRSGSRKDAQDLLTMYTRPQALGALGLLSGSSSGAQRQYTAHASAGPPDLIAAYMLFDRWQRRADGEGSVRLSALGRDPEWVGRICLMPPGAIRALIDRLERRGLVAFADTQYEPVTRRYTGDPAELVQRHYAER